MQIGAMHTLRLDWSVRRLLRAVIALAMLLLAIAAHPPALEAAELPVAQITHTHSQQTSDHADLSHRLLHHDHHVEMGVQLASNIAGFSNRPMSVVQQDGPHFFQTAVERPPRAAWC